MKTLFISFDNKYPLHTEGNIVVLKYDLLNDLLYEVGAELVFQSKVELPSDKSALVTDFKNDRPSEFESFSIQILKYATNVLLKNEVDLSSSIKIYLPDSYIEWLKYHTNPDYKKIGTIISSSPYYHITLQIEDLWDYLLKFLNTEVKGTINSDNEIQKFTFAETNDEKPKCATRVSSLRENLSYEMYDGSWVLCELGTAFFNGVGANKDISQAISLYTKAIEKGNNVAANWMGWCYQTGNEIEKDETMAFEFYRKGSELGNSNSDANLGYCYHLGIGTAVDYHKAVEYYTKGAEANIVFAQTNLANIYYDGLIGSPNFVEAFKWYSEAAKNNDQLQAKFKVGSMLLEGKGTIKDEKKAFEYFLSASKGGLKEAHYQLGKLTEDGFGYSFSETKDASAIDAYKKGMEAGDARCAWAIVELSKKNWVIRSKAIDALIWLKENGDSNGIYELASYILTWGKKDDRRLSKYNVDKLMTEASKKGSTEATRYLKDKTDKEKEAERKLEEQRAAIERTRLEEEKKKEEEERIKKEKIRAENKLAEDFLRLHNQTIEAIHLYWGKNGKSDDNEEIQLLIEPARKRIPLAKAYLGMLLLARNPRNVDAMRLLTSSVIPDQEIANEYKRIGDYIRDKRIVHPSNNTLAFAKYYLWANCSGIHGDCYALLATPYLQGLGIPKNLNKAIELIEKGMEPNKMSDFTSNYAHFLYAICRYKGEGVIRDLKDAQEHFEIASSDKNGSPAVPVALLTLGKIYDDRKMIFEAAERTDADACYELAERLYNEDEAYAQAEKWYNAAILNSNGNPEIIKKVETRLREIGGRVMTYTPPKMIEVYFDEIGPTLEKPKSVKGDKSSDTVSPIPQKEVKKTPTTKVHSSKAKAKPTSTNKGKSPQTKTIVTKEEKAKESIFSKIRKLFQ